MSGNSPGGLGEFRGYIVGISTEWQLVGVVVVVREWLLQEELPWLPHSKAQEHM